MEVILNKPMYNTEENSSAQYKVGFWKGVTSFIGDLVGYNIFRRKEKYLFPSDHFGLSASFNLASK
jgi:hypothetical protein